MMSKSMQGMWTKGNVLVLLVLLDVAFSLKRHCLPGQETKRNETSNEIECIDCRIGSYSKTGKKCYQCSLCHKGQSEIRKCTRTRNTLCRCAKGTYLKGQAICKMCSTCPKGMIQTRDCDHNMDRACRKCPDGLTTNSTNGRVCVPIKVPAHVPNVIIRHIVDWWIFLFIPAVVVLVGILAVIYYWRIKKKKNSKKTQVLKNDIYELGDRYAPEPAPEQVLFVSQETGNYRMVRDLPAHLYEELGLKLNNHHSRNWVYLAGMLGFSRDQIRYLELEPREATQNLINDWSSKNQSTVYNLYRALMNMNRADAAKVIKDYIYW